MHTAANRSAAAARRRVARARDCHRSTCEPPAGEAWVGLEAAQMAHELRPDATVIDLVMPIQTRLAAVRFMAEVAPDTSCPPHQLHGRALRPRVAAGRHPLLHAQDPVCVDLVRAICRGRGRRDLPEPEHLGDRAPSMAGQPEVRQGSADSSRPGGVAAARAPDGRVPGSAGNRRMAPECAPERRPGAGQWLDRGWRGRPGRPSTCRKASSPAGTRLLSGPSAAFTLSARWAQLCPLAGAVPGSVSRRAGVEPVA